MPKVSVEANQCAVCMHVWLAILPKRCAKCKSMRWNSVPLVQSSVPMVQPIETISAPLVPVQLTAKLASLPARRVHDKRTCTTYGCFMCQL